MGIVGGVYWIIFGELCVVLDMIICFVLLFVVSFCGFLVVGDFGELLDMMSCLIGMFGGMFSVCIVLLVIVENMGLDIWLLKWLLVVGLFIDIVIMMCGFGIGVILMNDVWYLCV